MAPQLKNIVRFINVAAGASATLAHGLNTLDEGAIIPDEIKLSNTNFVVTATTTTNLTVRNDGAAADNCDALVEHWHTIERTFGPDTVTDLTPQPFVGNISGSAGIDRFSPPEKWTQQNVAANQANVDLFALVSTSFNTIKMVRGGSITGLSTRLTQAITDANVDSLVVTVTINGVAGTLTISHSAGVNNLGGVATQLPGVDVFVAGDLIGVEITATLATFAPTTTDLEAWLEMEF